MSLPFVHTYFSIYMKQDLMLIFAVSSNFTLDVFYNGSSYELFSQSALHIAWWSEKKLQKNLSRLNLQEQTTE